MDTYAIKFNQCQTVLRFLVYKITPNLYRIYFDSDTNSHEIKLTAIYYNPPSEVELELLDDIVTNSMAHLPYDTVEAEHKLIKDFDKDEKHDYVVFAMFEPYEE